MEMQWKSTPCSHLCCTVREIQNQEQTLEIRLTEGMPDIGRVLCAWGQPQLREKQWRSEEVGISGGVQAWVLYVPEDGSQLRCVEGWIPFQAKWKLPSDSRDGFIRADLRLRSMDARAISSRKMILRASIAMLVETLQQRETPISQPGEVPEGVFLLQKTYPAQLAKEAGEKLFTVEETINIDAQQMEKFLCCHTECQVTENAVSGGRVVIRGVLRAQCIYIGEDGRLHSAAQEIPFAQLAELEQDYDKEAYAHITMSCAGVGVSAEEGVLRLRCDMIGQYVIYDRCLMQVTEDAYSPHRAISPMLSQLEVPVVLDRLKEHMDGELELHVQAQNVVDVTFLPDHPAYYREDDELVVEVPGVFQILYYDSEDNLQSNMEHWAGHWKVRAGEQCNFSMYLEQTQAPTAMVLGDKVRLRGDLALHMQTGVLQQIPMVTGLEVGQMMLPDPERPSLILRRPDGLSLWQLAKDCGSTVDAIERANGLVSEPDPEHMLLIPVL